MLLYEAIALSKLWHGFGYSTNTYPKRNIVLYTSQISTEGAREPFHQFAINASFPPHFSPPASRTPLHLPDVLPAHHTQDLRNQVHNHHDDALELD